MDVTRTEAPSNRDAAWCNPPYSRLREWLRKCASEGARVPVVALIPARTDTAEWHESVMPLAHSVLLLRGRVRFVGATAGAPFPSAVVVWLPGHRGGPRVEAWDWRIEVPA
jgi:site-specific DNA-methyltransferase (adenine-specific)